jgi:hypothetical protein
MRFLFRLKDTDVFITTEDPKVRYDILCGHCGYPVADADGQCPRCQRMLEDCPVCSRARKRKPLRSEPSPEGEKTCSVCGIRRLPFGVEALRRVRASFCTNLYGCPAGGLLLRTEEVALLPPGATLCPICRNEAFPPHDILTFRHVVQRCLFCSACLGQLPAWPMDTASAKVDLLEMGPLEPPADENHEPCILCGRNDHFVEGEEQAAYVQVAAEEVIVPQYLSMVQLGRALALEKDDGHAFSLSFSHWFNALSPSPPDDPVAVERLVSLLLLGTLREEVLAILKPRVEAYCAGWARTVPEGIGYRFRARPGGKGKRYTV